MGLYGDVLLPRVVHHVCGLAPAMRQRARIVPRARGRVVEIGIGSGHNLACYDPARVERVAGVDPSDAMFDRARRAARERGIALELVRGSAAAMPFPDGDADTVVATFTLCTVPDVAAALDEVRRVLRAGGALLFCEHGEAPDPSIRRWQRRLDPLWSRVAGGCRLGRPIPRLLEAAGFAVADLETGYLPGWRPASYHYLGVATPGGRDPA